MSELTHGGLVDRHQPLRLITPEGEPTLSLADRELLTQARRFAEKMGGCHGKLIDGLLADDVTKVTEAVLQLRSISMFLAEFIKP